MKTNKNSNKLAYKNSWSVLSYTSFTDDKLSDFRLSIIAGIIMESGDNYNFYSQYEFI